MLHKEDFLKAVVNNDLKKVMELFELDPLIINVKDKRGRSAVLLATMSKHCELVKYLVAGGADINQQDDISLNPLLWACINNDLTIVKIMVEANADLTKLTRFGGNPVVPAAEKGHLEIVEYLVKNSDVNVNHTNTLGWTALIEAIILNDGGARQQKIIELLLTHDADPNMVDPYGKTPLTLAKEKGYNEIADILVKFGGV